MNDYAGWLTSKEVSLYLRCHQKTAERLMSTGDIKAVKFGQTYRTTREWCDTYMEGLAA